MLAALTVWPKRTFKFLQAGASRLSILIIGHYPNWLLKFWCPFICQRHCLAGWPQVVLIPFWLLPYPLDPNHLPLFTFIRFSTLDHLPIRWSHGELRRAHDLKANKREVHPIDRPDSVKTPDLVTSWRPLANNTRLYAGTGKPSLALKVTLHTILLGVGCSIYTSNTLHHLK